MTDKQPKKDFFILEARANDGSEWCPFGFRGPEGQLALTPFSSITEARKMAVRLLDDLEDITEARTVRYERREHSKPIVREEDEKRIIV